MVPLLFPVITVFLASFVDVSTKTSLQWQGLPGPAVPNPKRPKPNWSWDTVPIAFHGANQSGEFNKAALESLASNYLMVTIEKWYTMSHTKCASKHPFQNGTRCNVEKAMYSAFNTIKAINSNVTTIMYLNSMFDFTMYHLAELIEDAEAAGQRMLLRDMHDKLVLLCNDGNLYCNVTNFDWSQSAMLQLWLEAVENATNFGE